MSGTASYRLPGKCELVCRMETADDVHTFMDALIESGTSESGIARMGHYIASVNHRTEVTKALGEYGTISCVDCAAHACV